MAVLLGAHSPPGKSGGGRNCGDPEEVITHPPALTGPPKDDSSVDTRVGGTYPGQRGVRLGGAGSPGSWTAWPPGPWNVFPGTSAGFSAFCTSCGSFRLQFKPRPGFTQARTPSHRPPGLSSLHMFSCLQPYCITESQPQERAE